MNWVFNISHLNQKDLTQNIKGKEMAGEDLAEYENSMLQHNDTHNTSFSWTRSPGLGQLKTAWEKWPAVLCGLYLSCFATLYPSFYGNTNLDCIIRIKTCLLAMYLSYVLMSSAFLGSSQLVAAAFRSSSSRCVHTIIVVIWPFLLSGSALKIQTSSIRSISSLAKAS